jgi:carbamoyltransferase
MTAILGISAFYHDSAAALIVDGDIVAAAQEERFSRQKHDHRFPNRAIEYCLDAGRLTSDQLDYVGFYEKPLLRFERLLETHLAFAPTGFRAFLTALPSWVQQKLHLPREIQRGLRQQFKKRPIFCEHHQSHAASGFFPSPFRDAAILTFDGVGEWATASYGIGRGNRITLSHELHFPHSLGLLYSAFTSFCGFKVNSGEHKLMGLAPFGKPIYRDAILTNLIDVKPDGSFRLDLSYFQYCQGLRMTSAKFAQLFGGPAREPESPLTQREMDLAASIQAVTEEILLRAARHVYRQTGMKNLCLAGGVALNCVANGRLLREGPFERLWIQPAAGDAGGALGVALFVWHQLLDNPRIVSAGDRQAGSLLGPSYSNEQIGSCLRSHGATFRRITDESELLSLVVDHIEAGEVVGWFQGRAEYGPRALGCRSILGDPRDPKMQQMINQKIKYREPFRPFAPAVARDRTNDFFHLGEHVESPYMLLVANVAERPHSIRGNSLPRETGSDRDITVACELPAITHVDGSARIQTVDAERHGRFYRLLKAFELRTGCPVLINTSFNVRGEPPVCSPDDAYRCFMGTGMDVLIMEEYVLLKRDQPATRQLNAGDYMRRFPLD